jgi:geranylgeranyl diphosphate synthase type I
MAHIEAALAEAATALRSSGGHAAAQASHHWASLLLRPGKRIRPYLCVVGYELAESRRRAERPSGLLQFAAALEILHAFLLVHDDIADRAETRRSEPSLHVLLRPPAQPRLTEGDRQRLGNDLAVIAGDLLYTFAMERMIAAPGLPSMLTVPAMQEVLSVCRATAEGQFNDVAASGRRLSECSPEESFEICRLKTARYTFEAPLVAGARLADARPEKLAALRAFSHAAGIAFQLEDDLIALFSDDAAEGKPGLADLREGKKTWPLLVAFQRASTEDRQWLEELFVRHSANDRDLARVRTLLRQTGAFDAALHLVDQCCADAQRALHPLADSPAVAELIGITAWLSDRARSLR